MAACTSALTRRRKQTRCLPPPRINLKTEAANRPLRLRQARSRLAKRSNPGSKSLRQPKRLRRRRPPRPAPRHLLNRPRTEPLQIELEIKPANRRLCPRQARNRPARPSNRASKLLNQPNRHRRLRRRTLRHLLDRRQPKRVQPPRRHQLPTTWRQVPPRRRVAERPGNRRSKPMQPRARATPGQGVSSSGSARRAIRSSPARTCSVRRFPA